MRTLLHLDFRNCSKLTNFLVDVSGLKRLEKLFLSGCSNLSVLPENIGAMTCLQELLLDGTAIKNLPESIYRLENLEKLSLKGCRSIKELPLCVGTLTSLEELYLDETGLQNLPSSIGNLKSLQKLHLIRCASLSKIPDTIIELSSLEKLFINGSAVEELPLNLGSLPCLTDFSAGDCTLLQLQLDSTPIKTLPEEIGKLHFIRKLELRNCKSLTVLPESIGDMDTLESLHLVGSNIEKLPKGFGKLENLVLLRMNNCKKLKRLPESFGDLKSLHRLIMQETSVAELPESFGNLSNLRVLKMLKKPLFRSSESDNAPGTSGDSFLLTHTLLLSGVPRKSDDQLNICRYSAVHPMVTFLKDGYTIQVIKRESPYIKSVELKMHGIHLVYEGDDDFSDEEDTLTKRYLTVSQKLANFFSSFKEGEASSEGASTDA